MVDSSLNDFSEIVMGQSPPGETCNTSKNGLPLLNGPTEYGPHHPTPVQFTTDARKQARRGDLLFCVRGSTTGRMNWADREYAIGRGVAAIRHKKKPELQPFVRAVIEYSLPSLLAQATGSTFPNVSADQLAGLWWPPLEEDEQRAIACILGALDDKIELNRRMNETLEAMAQAHFKLWFVDVNPDCVKTENWREGKVEDLALLSKDAISPNEFPNETFDHYSIPAFDEGRLPKAELGKKIQSNKFLVLPNAVLLSKLNPRIPRIWFPNVGRNRRSVCSTEFLVAISQHDVSREFLYGLFGSQLFLEIFASLVTGTSGSHQRFKPDYLLAMDVAIPPKELIARFTKSAQPLYKRVVQNIEESCTLAALRNTLLPKLISGELRVKDATRFLEKAAV